MVDRFDQFPTILLLADAIQSNGIETLKDITVLAMLRCTTMFVNKALDFFEARDNTLFTWGAALRFLLLNFDAKFGQ